MKESREIKKRYDQQLPNKINPPNPHNEMPPWIDKHQNISIYTTVPHLTRREEHSDISKKILTMTMLEERYPQEAWIRVYTDGSATNAVWRGGAGVYIQLPNGQQQTKAIPTGLHCTNYRAEVEALVHAAKAIREISQPVEQVVFLTDAMSVLEALKGAGNPTDNLALNHCLLRL